MATSKSYERLYGVWANMIQRCHNAKSASYKNYGLRGISVCSEWRTYESFRGWALAKGYRRGLSIERVDVDGNYEPSNCKWIERDEQMRNLQVHKRQATLDSLTAR